MEISNISPENLEILLFLLGFAGVTLGLHLINLVIQWYVFKTEWILKIAVQMEIARQTQFTQTPEGTQKKLTFKEMVEKAKAEGDRKAKIARDKHLDPKNPKNHKKKKSKPK